MRIPRLRLRTLMVLVFVSAIALGITAQVLRMAPIDFADIQERLLILAMFVILVGLKLTLLVVTQRRRRPTEDRPEA